MTLRASASAAEALQRSPGQENEPPPAASLTAEMVRRRNVSPQQSTQSPPAASSAGVDTAAETHASLVVSPADRARTRVLKDDAWGRSRAWADAGFFVASYVLALAAFLLFLTVL